MRPGTFVICRGIDVLIRGLQTHEEAVALADELSHTNHEPLVIVKVLDVIAGRMK